MNDPTDEEIGEGIDPEDWEWDQDDARDFRDFDDDWDDGEDDPDNASPDEED